MSEESKMFFPSYNNIFISKKRKIALLHENIDMVISRVVRYSLMFDDDIPGRYKRLLEDLKKEMKENPYVDFNEFDSFKQIELFMERIEELAVFPFLILAAFGIHHESVSKKYKKIDQKLYMKECFVMELVEETFDNFDSAHSAIGNYSLDFQNKEFDKVYKKLIKARGILLKQMPAIKKYYKKIKKEKVPLYEKP